MVSNKTKHEKTTNIKHTSSHHFVGSVDKGHRKGKVLSSIWPLLKGETPAMSGRDLHSVC